jgi:hypothetical protein
MKKLVNAKTFMIPCMRAGLCQYEDERVHVPQESLERMAKTAYGIPLIIDHVEQAQLENQLEKIVCGRVADMHYDTDTDLWMAHCVVETEDAVQKLESGWGVSTSYEVLSKGAGGTLNAVEYDSTIEDGKYLHLAIVQHPRYEMAVNPTFYNSADLQSEKPSLTLNNESESKGVFSMFKLFRTKREEVKENSSDVEIEVDGEKVSMNELVQAYKQAKAVPVDVEHVVLEDEAKMNEEVDALLAACEEEEKMAGVEIEVSAPGEEEEEKPVELEQEKEEEKEKDEMHAGMDFKEGMAKSNERFNALKAASFQAIIDNGSNGYQTLTERVAIGRSKYGSKK